MPPLTPEAAAALRAQLGFLRDLGIYDLYRRKPRSGCLPALTATAFVTDSALLPAPPSIAALPLETSQPAAPLKGELDSEAEDPDIAARKRALPTPPPSALAAQPLDPEDRPLALAQIRANIGDCTRCPLSAERTHIVFGDGDPNARILFVGEGPGADEDAQGVPFIGKAGQLLNNMITAMGLTRGSVYIANIVKCRPPGNRVPEPEEANTCTPFLFGQIGVVRPEVIVALGSTAATYLLGARSPLSALRGRVHPAFGAKLIVTYHPAFLLRDPRQKKEAWADLQLAMSELARP